MTPTFLASWTDVVGCLGAGSYLTGFFLQQLGWIDARGSAYALTKLAGSSLMLLSLSHNFNLGSVLIQIAWATIAVWTLWRLARLKVRLCSNASVGPLSGDGGQTG